MAHVYNQTLNSEELRAFPTARDSESLFHQTALFRCGLQRVTPKSAANVQV